jgi:flagellar basal-body rod protein FlgC
MPDPIMPGLFSGVDASASAMGAENARMTAAAENLAHAGSTERLANGLPYARQRVQFRTVLDAQGNRTGKIDAQIVHEGKYATRYDPSHPNADANGNVLEPRIDPILELTDLMVAGKAYDANVNAAKGLMKMHESALKLGSE